MVFHQIPTHDIRHHRHHRQSFENIDDWFFFSQNINRHKRNTISSLQPGAHWREQSPLSKSQAATLQTLFYILKYMQKIQFKLDLLKSF